MRPKHLLPWVSLLLTTCIGAQVNKSKTPAAGNYAFDKGKQGFTLMQNFNFDYFKRKYNGADYGHASDVSLNFDYNYFIQRNFGVGLEFSSDFSGTESTAGNKYTSHDWMTYLNFTYGTAISNDFDVYGRIGVVIGQDRSHQTNYPVQKDDLFGFHFEIGTPLRLGGGNTYLTPRIGFNHLQDKFDGGKELDNSIHFGLNLQSYLFCSETMCDLRNGCKLSRHSYDAGHSFLGYTTDGGFDFGTVKTKLSNFEQKDHVFDGSVNLYYGYYIVNNIALGAQFTWDANTRKDGVDYKSGSFLFMPMITLNAPAENCLNNLFLQGGYGFGAGKTTVNSSTSKDRQTSLCWKLGYNDFFSDRLAFTPKIGYEWNSFKQKGSNDKTRWSGIEFEIGATYFINGHSGK